MRIIAGRFKGRKLFFGNKKEHRPTQDRVKESLFNMIQDHCHGSIVLDGFAGTGSLGLEALSRGAKKVIFIDKDCFFIKKNTTWIDDTDSFQIHKLSLLNYLNSTEQKFDIIFLDPPWNQTKLYDDTLKLIFEFDILTKNGLIICEHPKDIVINELNLNKQIKTIGRTSLTILRQ